MKPKIVITIDEFLLEDVNEYIEKNTLFFRSRSQFIEVALDHYLYTVLKFETADLEEEGGD